MMDIYKSLAAAQKQMGPALKQASNPHFKSKYADLGTVQDACLDALHANGFAVFQPVGEDAIGRFVETVLAHETGETLRCRVPLVLDKTNMQGLGSAITYARRYGLMCMTGVCPEDDDGNASVTISEDIRARDDKAAQAAQEADRDAAALKWAEGFRDETDAMSPLDVADYAMQKIALIARLWPRLAARNVIVDTLAQDGITIAMRPDGLLHIEKPQAQSDDPARLMVGG